MREEAFVDQVIEDYYQAKDLLEEGVTYYNEERLHSALSYLRPVDYYKGHPEALLAERKRKIGRGIEQSGTSFGYLDDGVHVVQEKVSAKSGPSGREVRGTSRQWTS